MRSGLQLSLNSPGYLVVSGFVEANNNSKGLRMQREAAGDAKHGQREVIHQCPQGAPGLGLSADVANHNDPSFQVVPLLPVEANSDISAALEDIEIVVLDVIIIQRVLHNQLKQGRGLPHDKGFG